MNLENRLSKLEAKFAPKSKGVKVLYSLPDGTYSNKYQFKPQGFISSLKSNDQLITSSDVGKSLIDNRRVAEQEQEFFQEEDLLSLQESGYQLVIVEYMKKALS